MFFFFFSNVPLDDKSDFTINNVNTEINVESSTSVDRVVLVSVKQVNLKTSPLTFH